MPWAVYSPSELRAPDIGDVQELTYLSDKASVSSAGKESRSKHSKERMKIAIYN
jgi:hypothetical protein